MLLAQMEPGSMPTNIAALAVLALGLIVKDWAFNRSKVIREDKKVDELSEQTRLLTDIRDINKKSVKRIKKMARRVKDLHDKHIKPTNEK